MSTFKQTIAEYIGTSDPKFVSYFRELVQVVHRQMVERAEENNQAMADVFSYHGVSPAKFGAVVRLLRAGRDTVTFLHFDMLSEYAVANYRHLMPGCNGDSDSGSDESVFAQWLIRGYLRTEPKTSEIVLSQAAAMAGEHFLAAAEEADVPF